MTDVTHLLKSIEAGDPQAAEQLLPLVYEELRKLARQRMTQESPDHTLQGTALVHDAYLRLVGANQSQHWDNRGHFFAAAAEAMRRILVESARRKLQLKHGGDYQKIDLNTVEIAWEEDGTNLLELDLALTKLANQHPQKAELVKLRFFAGLTIEQAALAMGVSSSTVDRDWTYARVWLFREMSSQDKQ